MGGANERQRLKGSLSSYPRARCVSQRTGPESSRIMSLGNEHGFITVPEEQREGGPTAIRSGGPADSLFDFQGPNFSQIFNKSFYETKEPDPRMFPRDQNESELNVSSSPLQLPSSGFPSDLDLQILEGARKPFFEPSVGCFASRGKRGGLALDEGEVLPLQQAPSPRLSFLAYANTLLLYRDEAPLLKEVTIARGLAWGNPLWD